MNVKIESGIPIPEPRRGGGRHPKYPFDGMEVGDSFLVRHTSKKVRRSVQVSASHKNKRGHKKFITRAVELGTRVWRIE